MWNIVLGGNPLYEWGAGNTKERDGVCFPDGAACISGVIFPFSLGGTDRGVSAPPSRFVENEIVFDRPLVGTIESGPEDILSRSVGTTEERRPRPLAAFAPHRVFHARYR